MSGIPNRMLPVAVEMLPEGYRRLEYLENTGMQYIDSGVPYANDTCIETTFEITKFADGTHPALFGTEDSPNSPQARFGALLYTNRVRWDYGSEMQTEYVSLELNTKYKLKKDGPDNYIDDVLISSNAPSYFISGKNGLIFARVSNQGRFIGKIYSFTISRAGEMQRNFTPCLDDKGVPCMFDTVTRRPFRNKGIGQFLYG